MRVNEVAEELGVSVPYAYKLIRELNEELRKTGCICRAEHYRERPGDIEAAHGRLDRTGDCRQSWLQDRQRSP